MTGPVYSFSACVTQRLPSEPFVSSALAPYTSRIRAKCYIKSMCTAWIPSLWLGAKLPVHFLAFHTSHFRTFPPQHQSPLVSVAQAVVASLIGTRPYAQQALTRGMDGRLVLGEVP